LVEAHELVREREDEIIQLKVSNEALERVRDQHEREMIETTEVSGIPRSLIILAFMARLATEWSRQHHRRAARVVSEKL
jgi:hypothetical protein